MIEIEVGKRYKFCIVYKNSEVAGCACMIGIGRYNVHLHSIGSGDIINKTDEPLYILGTVVNIIEFGNNHRKLEVHIKDVEYL